MSFEFDKKAIIQSQLQFMCGLEIVISLVWTMVRILMKQTLSTNFEATNSDFSIKCVRFFAIAKDRIETKNKFLEKISENLSFVVSELVAGSSEQDIH